MTIFRTASAILLSVGTALWATDPAPRSTERDTTSAVRQNRSYGRRDALDDALLRAGFQFKAATEENPYIHRDVHNQARWSNELGTGFFNNEVKLTASDAAIEDRFGFAVSISGDTALVGVPDDDDAGAGSGSTYVYQRNAGGADNWGEVKKLIASDAGGGRGFGVCVSIDGNTAIIGTRANNAAYILERNEGGTNNWGEVTKLTGSDTVGADNFGLSAVISGDTAIVAAQRRCGQQFRIRLHLPAERGRNEQLG